MSERVDQLKVECNHRRSENRLTIKFVIELLSEFILPLRHDVEINNYLFQYVTENIYKNLKIILEGSTCTYFNAVCGELLWKHYHDKQLASLALNAFLSEIYSPTYDDGYYFTHMATGICRVYSKFKQSSFPIKSFFEICMAYVDKHIDDSGYCVLFILNGLFDCNVHSDQVENTILNAMRGFREKGNYSRAIAFSESLEKYYRRNKIKTESILIERAKDYELEAEQYDWLNPQSSQNIIHLIQSAMNTWSCIEGPTAKLERRRLAKKLDPVKQLSLKTMQEFASDPIDLTNAMSGIEEILSRSSFEEVILNCARLIPMKSPSVLKDEMMSAGFSFTAFASTSIIDSKGRKRCIVPSPFNATPEEFESLLEHKAGEEYILSADFIIKRFLWSAKERFSFTKENLQFIADSNCFIPPDRKDSFLIGLTAGFNLDLVTSMQVLMPQVENAIRILAENCGAVVYKTSSDGTEECLSFESVLSLPEVIDCLDETFLFNLKVFFTSVYGIGMRNIVSHGLNSDDELQSAPSLAAWWYTLRICCNYCPELRRRIISQQESHNEP